MKHTATPWDYLKSTDDNDSPCFDVIQTKNDGFTYLFEICIGKRVSYQEETEQEANAAFIVKAVNNHSQLLEALKTMKALVKFKYGNLDAGVWAEIQATEKLIEEAE